MIIANLLSHASYLFILAMVLKCGNVLKELDLSVRNWTCPSCNAQHQRDINAAINIHRVGASTLRGETVRATSIA